MKFRTPEELELYKQLRILLVREGLSFQQWVLREIRRVIEGASHE